MKARYKALVDCCSLSEPHCIELQNAAVAEQIEIVWGKRMKESAQIDLSRSGDAIKVRIRCCGWLDV